ncbi:MAG: hypothetical protein AAF682_09885 [Planctomycetota bacterium]
MKPAILLAAAALTLSAPDEVTVEATELAWEQLSPQLFDLAWQLPDERTAPGRDLLAEMERLAALRLEARGPRGEEYRCLGDLARAARAADDADGWLKAVLRSSPKLEADWGAGLRELLRCSELFEKDWNPEDDGSRDGLLVGGTWDLTKEGAPFNQLEVDAIAQQGATLMFADLATIKAAENDYRLYPNDPGSSYEEIYPLADTFVRGTDPQGNGFSALRIRFRCDLPLWYPDYRCTLRLLNRIDPKGRLACDIYSTSSDFHWLAGRDVYLPLDASDGERVAYLVVRQYGFDLDDVPDSEKNVREALRGSLGNLRRRSEALAGEAGASKDRGPARIPEFVARGDK